MIILHAKEEADDAKGKEKERPEPESIILLFFSQLQKYYSQLNKLYFLNIVRWLMGNFSFGNVPKRGSKIVHNWVPSLGMVRGVKYKGKVVEK